MRGLLLSVASRGCFCRRISRIRVPSTYGAASTQPGGPRPRRARQWDASGFCTDCSAAARAQGGKATVSPRPCPCGPVDGTTRSPSCALISYRKDRIPSDLRSQPVASWVSSTVGDNVRSPGGAHHPSFWAPPSQWAVASAHGYIRTARCPGRVPPPDVLGECLEQLAADMH